MQVLTIGFLFETVKNLAHGYKGKIIGTIVISGSNKRRKRKGNDLNAT